MDKEKAPVTQFPPVDFGEFAPTSYEEWKDASVAALKGAPFEKKLFTKTYEGITLEPVYTLAHSESFAQKKSFPGAEDFLRGADAAGYIEKPWCIAQSSDADSPAAANAILKQELAKGTTAISFAPTEGLCPKTAADIKTLLDGIDISKYPFNVYAGASASALLQLIKDYAGSTAVSGVIGADPIGALALEGQLDAALDSYYDKLAADITWAKKNMPQVKTIFIQGAVYHNGGANAIQEVAACLTTAINYIDELQKRGLSVDDIAGQICFGFSLGANFFMEIAKLRAARVLWAQVVKAYGGSKESAKLDAFARTSYFTTTVYDPYVNILRATTQAFSGVVGGVNAMQVAPFDDVIRKSDEHSRRIARNIQVMMQNEFNLLSPVDPAGGSWYVETLTGQLAEAIWAKLQNIEAAGGIAAVLASGTLQDEIAAVLSDRFKKLATRSDRAVGNNMYANMLEMPLTGEAKPAKAAPAGKAAVTVKAIKPHRWTEQFEALRKRTEDYKAKTGKNIQVFLANMGPIPQHKARADFATGFMEVGSFEVLKNDGFASIEEAAKAAIASKATVTVICSTDATYPEIVPELAKAIKAGCPQMKVMLAGAPAPEYKDSYVEAGVDDFIHVKANCYQILSEIQIAGGIANE